MHFRCEFLVWRTAHKYRIIDDKKIEKLPWFLPLFHFWNTRVPKMELICSGATRKLYEKSTELIQSNYALD